MKRKILALVLAAAMVFSTVPVFADGGVSWLSTLKKAKNPLYVNGDADGINYASLGDSVAYGFGLPTAESYDDLQGGLTSYKKEIEGAYPILIKDYLKCDSANFFQGAVCSARQMDLCEFIDKDTVTRDFYSEDSVWKIFLSDINEETVYNDFANGVKDADFITISAGGNTVMTSLIFVNTTWGTEDFDDKIELERYYSKTAVASFNNIKKSILAKAEALDKAAKKTETEETYTYKVEKAFDMIETVLYQLGQNTKDSDKLLDLIHEKNPNAVIAYLGLSTAFSEYNLKIGSILIDLEKIMVPMVGALNLAIKNAAEERSSYVRYIDISDVDLIEMDGFGPDISLDMNLKVILTDYTAVTHPSLKGHQQIAERILQNFKFRTYGSNYYKTKNVLSNIQTSIKSRVGIQKIENIIDVLKSVNLKGIIKIDWSGMFEKLKA